ICHGSLAQGWRQHGHDAGSFFLPPHSTVAPCGSNDWLDTLSYHWVRQPAAEQCFHLRPNLGIAFDLNVALGKQAGIPRKISTLCRLLFVLPPEIAENCRK